MNEVKWHGRLPVWFGILAGLAGLAEADHGMAGDWTSRPFLSGSAILTDNVQQQPEGQASGDLILDVRPGISLHGEGGRVKLQLDYEVEGAFYVSNSDLSSITQRLNFSSTTELVSDRLFLDVGANYFQSPLTPGASANFDAPLVDGTFANVGFARITPRWREHLGTFADSELTLGYTITRFDGSTASNSDILDGKWRLQSGTGSGQLQWSLNADRSLVNYSGNTPDDTHTDIQLGLSYALTREWALLARSGYINDDVSDFQNVQNGSYWSTGLRWQPSQKLAASVWYGPKDKEALLELHPSERTTFSLSRTDRSVGENAGPRWEMGLSHRTAHSVWGASYTDEVTTIQQATASGNGLISFLDPVTGQAVYFDPVSGRLLNQQQVFTLRNGSFERKRFELNSSYEKGRSLLYGSLYNEQRTFLSGTMVEEKSVGANLTWSLRVAPRTHSLLGADWQRTSSSDGTSDGDLLVGRIGLTHQLAADVDGLLEYRHTRNDAQGDLGFDENRLTMTINMRF